MESNTNLVGKFLKYVFAASILVWFGMTFLVEEFALMDITAGFVYEPRDPEALMILYILAAFSALTMVLQFLVPNWLKTRFPNPAGTLNVDLIRYAFCESIAVFGFLVFLLSSQRVESWIFMGLALLLLLFGDRAATKAL